jgi:hypothetical protein
MARKKKLIWFEQETVVGGAGEARRRGASEGGVRRSHEGEPYYGPVTVDSDDDDPVDPDAPRLNAD